MGDILAGTKSDCGGMDFICKVPQEKAHVRSVWVSLSTDCQNFSNLYYGDQAKLQRSLEHKRPLIQDDIWCLKMEDALR